MNKIDTSMPVYECVCGFLANTADIEIHTAENAHIIYKRHDLEEVLPSKQRVEDMLEMKERNANQ